MALCLFRIAQECLGNIVKHSGAKVVRVELNGAVHAVLLTVEDDGIGFDPKNVRGGGLGLVSMRERLRLVGGTMRVKTVPSHGTCVEAQIPLVANTESKPKVRVAHHGI
jgi:signal transduction histidine kinase